MVYWSGIEAWLNRGRYAKIAAYALQDTGLDTYDANLALGHGEDERNYAVAAQMLQALGAPRWRC